MSQTIKQVEDIRSSKQAQSTQHSQLEQVHVGVKSKVKVLEEQLEKCLSQQQAADLKTQDIESKYTRITELIEEVWRAEVG